MPPQDRCQLCHSLPRHLKQHPTICSRCRKQHHDAEAIGPATFQTTQTLMIPPPQATPLEPAAANPVQQLDAMATPIVASTATASPAIIVPVGLYLGHRVMPLTQKLLSKILNLEFMEIHDLLPETWLSLTEDKSTRYPTTWYPS